LNGNRRCREKRLNVSAVLHSVDHKALPASLMKLPINEVLCKYTRDKVATLLNQRKSFNDQQGHLQVWTWAGIVKVNFHLSTASRRTSLLHLA
jgi:hypothetical protein